MDFTHLPCVILAARPIDGSSSGWLSLWSAIVALLAAVLGLGQYFRFRTRRQKQEAVGRAFSEVLRGLGSQSEVERLASAALTRRFFDRTSEFGIGRLPYAADTVRVVSAVLRSEPTGTTQKLLADGLKSAPSLAYCDFQRVNLRDCYWGAGATDRPTHAHGADFYGADLSSASLRRAILRKAVFREAQLIRTVLNESDCREADFRGADLRGASFDGALLLGARFDDALQVPQVISENLIAGSYASPEPVATAMACADVKQDLRVFVSAPSYLSRFDQIALDQVLIALSAAGLEAVRLLPPAYGRTAPMSDIANRIRSCGAVVIFGPPQFVSTPSSNDTNPELSGRSMLVSTPWNHIEAGIAVGLDKPLLIVQQGSRGGVFDVPDHAEMITVVDVSESGSLVALDDKISAWARTWRA